MTKASPIDILMDLNATICSPSFDWGNSLNPIIRGVIIEGFKFTLACSGIPFQMSVSVYDADNYLIDLPRKDCTLIREWVKENIVPKTLNQN